MAHLEAFFRGSKNSRTYDVPKSLQTKLISTYQFYLALAKIFLTLKIPLSEPFSNLFANLTWSFYRVILYGLGKFMYLYFLGI